MFSSVSKTPLKGTGQAAHLFLSRTKWCYLENFHLISRTFCSVPYLLLCYFFFINFPFLNWMQRSLCVTKSEFCSPLFSYIICQWADLAWAAGSSFYHAHFSLFPLCSVMDGGKLVLFNGPAHCYSIFCQLRFYLKHPYKENCSYSLWSSSYCVNILKWVDLDEGCGVLCLVLVRLDLWSDIMQLPAF